VPSGAGVTPEQGSSMADKGEYTYPYPRPMVTADALVYSTETPPRVLLVQRKCEPFAGCWAMPGGFCEMDETLEQAVERELAEETGVSGLRFTQYRTVSTVDRDPRGRIITTVFLAEGDPARLKPQASDDAAGVAWWPMEQLPPMAADHAEIITEVCDYLRSIARESRSTGTTG
jgi:8-oxo-dGTP diphosphatase